MEIKEAVSALLVEAGRDIETGHELLPLMECTGRILAEDITAESDVPSFNRSAMDGYAAKAEDIIGASENSPVYLRVVGELLAGDYREIAYEKGTAVRVMTGAFIPDGYDCVIRQEDTDLGGEIVAVYRSVPAYMNYCKKGEDVKKGTTLLKAGTMLTPMHIGIIASLGQSHVPVKKSIRTAIISTGSEICMPGEELTKGKIYNNSAYMIAAAIKAAKMEVSSIIRVRDDEDALGEEIKSAAKSSRIIITTGAVSVGKRDIIPAVLEGLAARIIFRGVNIQPGTPTIGAVYEDCLLLCLSGNPFAALANFEVYYWEAAASLMGCEDLRSEISEAVLMSEYKKKNTHTRLIRAYAKDGRVFLPESVHASSVVSNLISCNCFIELEAGREVQVGDRVRIRYFKVV